MTPYHDSLWANAPEGATHWALQNNFDVWFFFKKHGSRFYKHRAGDEYFDWAYEEVDFIELHPRPAAYRTPQQLEAEYLAEHREEVGRGLVESGLDLDDLLYNSTFNRILLEKHLAAERARIEGEGK